MNIQITGIDRIHGTQKPTDQIITHPDTDVDTHRGKPAVHHDVLDQLIRSLVGELEAVRVVKGKGSVAQKQERQGLNQVVPPVAEGKPVRVDEEKDKHHHQNRQ